MICPLPFGSFPQILKFDLRLHTLPVERGQPRQVGRQHIEECDALPIQANQARLSGNTCKFGRQIDSILKITDIIDKLPGSRA
jgi:hypothetical protein